MLYSTADAHFYSTKSSARRIYYTVIKNQPGNESPRLEGSNLDTGEGRTTVASTCSEDDSGVLKPQGGTAADNATTERTVVGHIHQTAKMRIGTWNVRSRNLGKLVQSRASFY